MTDRNNSTSKRILLTAVYASVIVVALNVLVGGDDVVQAAKTRALPLGELDNIVGGACRKCEVDQVCILQCTSQADGCSSNLNKKCVNTLLQLTCTQMFDNEDKLFCGKVMRWSILSQTCVSGTADCGLQNPNTCADS